MYFERPVWAEIDLLAFRHNVSSIRSLLSSKTQLCPIIKADGYGHGAIPLAFEAISLGADRFGVAILHEALTLRSAGVALPILILGYTPNEQVDDVVEHSLTQTIYTKEQAEALSYAGRKAGRDVTVHVKVDTGMNRIGITPSDALAYCSYVKSLPNITLEGIYTHFVSSDSFDKTLTNRQFLLFKNMLDALERADIHIPLKHCANSAAILDMPETHLDMVRPGIILYGLWPSTEVSTPISLMPVMQLKSKFSMVKYIPSGSTVSYGATYTADTEKKIGTIPIGYADGYTRMLSGKAHVVVNGKRAPIVGRICMDQCMADVSDIENVRSGDTVLLFGGKDMPVEEIAHHLGTINYEITCMVGKRVPRVYIKAT